MKTLLLTLMFFILNLTSTDLIGKYEIESEYSFDTLELKKDGTYEYKSRGDSCWEWSDFRGTWELKTKQLILHHNYSYEEDATEFIEKTDKISKNFVSITITDNLGKPISNFELSYSPTYNQRITKPTDKNGVVIFDKRDTNYDENDKVGIFMKYKTNGNDTTLNTSIYGVSDRITIRINSEPKIINKHKEYRFSIENGKIKSIEFPYVDDSSTYKKL